MTERLHRTLKEIVKLSFSDWLSFNGTIAFNRAAGLWRYPIPTSGDFESMTRKDIAYWMYKAEHPVKRAVKGSGLEAFFERQAEHSWGLPPGFTPSCRLTVSAVGDLLDHPYLPHSGDVFYDQVSDLIFGSDLTMANLECVLNAADAGDFTITLKSSPPLVLKPAHFKVIKGVRDRKYSFMATANNHSLDCGEVGVRETIDTLKAEGIAFHGTNETEDASRSATVFEKNGVRIGLISHTFGLNAKKPPVDKPWLVNRSFLNLKVGEIDFSKIERQLESATRQGVDFKIAHLHWGLEHEYYPRPEQLDVAHHLAEMGVDAIIGHHSHVIQPVEYYRTRRDADRVVPIYYSLGNLTTSVTDPAFRLSGVADLQLCKGSARDGSPKTYVAFARMEKVFQEIDFERRKIFLRKTNGQS